MIYKRGRIYWYKFVWDGECIRQSTRQGNDKVARNMESAHRSRLARQQKEEDAACEKLGCAEVLICHECEKLFNSDKVIRNHGKVFCTSKCATAWGQARNMPTLQSFLDDRFIRDAEIRHKAKPKTLRYYRQGAGMLKRSRLAGLRLDELTGEHTGQFASEFGKLSPSGINMGLRTLRRSLNLAYEWGILEKPVKVELAKGETQRDRVLSTAELDKYIEACPQPWRDCAAIIANEGMRPGEVFVLQWEHVLIGDNGTGLIRVVDGKSKAARRILPMTPEVHALLKARHQAQGCPANGWILATAAKGGHLEAQTAKRQHKAALETSKVDAFVPYILRHTALTRLAKAAGGDVFALAKIAGHSSITVSQKYVHPEAETIDKVFSRLCEVNIIRQVGTKLGTAETSDASLAGQAEP